MGRMEKSRASRATLAGCRETGGYGGYLNGWQWRLSRTSMSQRGVWDSLMGTHLSSSWHFIPCTQMAMGWATAIDPGRRHD